MQTVQPLMPGLPFGTIPLKARNIEVRLPIGLLGFGRRQGPGKSKVHSQIAGNAPVVLHEGTKQFPAAAGCSAQECLIVGRKNSQTTQQ